MGLMQYVFLTTGTTPVENPLPPLPLTPLEFRILPSFFASLYPQPRAIHRIVRMRGTQMTSWNTSDGKLSSVSESKVIVETADTAIFIHKLEGVKNNDGIVYRLKLLKKRDGDVDTNNTALFVIDKT